MDAKGHPKWFQNLALGIQGSDFEILGGFDRRPIFDDFLSGQKIEKHLKKEGGAVKRGSPAQGSAEHPCSSKSFWSLQSQKNSSEFAMNLGRPVPCEQGAADYPSAQARVPPPPIL